MILNNVQSWNGNKIDMTDLKDEIPDQIIDHCVGLMLIKPICNNEVWEYLDTLGKYVY